jgi:hypothetical protein
MTVEMKLSNEVRFCLLSNAKSCEARLRPGHEHQPTTPARRIVQKYEVMSFLRKSIGSRALSSSARRIPRQSSLIHGRTYSDNATRPDKPSGSTLGESSLVKQEGPTESMVRHQPDYNVVTDYRISYVWFAMKASIQHHAHSQIEHSLQSPSGSWMAANPVKLCLQQSSRVRP